MFTSKYRILLLLIIISMMQISCGFRPLYSTFHSNSLPNISVQPVNSVEGAELYQTLIEILGVHNKPDYDLHIDLDYKTSNLAITDDSSVIKQSITQTAKYTLHNSVSGAIITSGTISSFGVCSTMLGSYNSYVEESQTKIHLAKEVASTIYARLLMYFTNNKNTNLR